jgi:hypothetical protein
MSTPDQHTDQGGDAEKPRADATGTDATGTDHEDAGTSGGNPVAGVTISEEEAEQAVTPDDKPQEVDGPEASAGHA